MKAPGVLAMRRRRQVGSIVMVLVGLLWFLQGIGVVGGSFMSGQNLWAMIGAVVFLGGLVVWPRTSQRR